MWIQQMLLLLNLCLFFIFLCYLYLVLPLASLFLLQYQFIVMEGEIISQEERKRLDRQRFIGWQTQRKLLNSRVLITPANGPNTELAKNLILAGVNVTIYDDAIVNEDDFESNFLIAESDIGKKRAFAVFEKLKQMNPTGKNEAFDQNLVNGIESLNPQDFTRYTIIATSITDFSLAARWDQFSKKINVPYYNLICCGLYAFVFISLGGSYNYKEINKKDNSVSKIWTIRSLNLSQSLQWNHASKNKEFIAAIRTIAKAQEQGMIYNPFAHDQQTFQNIVNFGVELAGEKHRDFLAGFVRTYGIDYCPVYSIIGSIISQQVIKIAENQTQPGLNWLVFNSEEGYGNIVKLSTQKEGITNQVPTQ